MTIGHFVRVNDYKIKTDMKTEVQRNISFLDSNNIGEGRTACKSRPRRSKNDEN